MFAAICSSKRTRREVESIATVVTGLSAAYAPVVRNDPTLTFGGVGQVNLQWYIPTLRVDDSAIGTITNFKVYEAGSLIATLSGASSSANVTGLSAGTRRYTVTCTAEGAEESDAAYGVSLTVT